MIYTVTLNPSLDYVMDVADFKTGGLNRTSAVKLLPGGKGINVSIVLRHLGWESTALGFTAGFTGEHLAALLQKEQVETSFIKIPDGRTRINVKLRSGEETEINAGGPVLSEADIHALYQKLDMLSDEDTLVLAGSIPDSLPQSAYQDIMKYLAKKNVRIAVDAAGSLLRNVLELHPFLIKPNHIELGELFGVTIQSKEEAALYAGKLREQGAVNVLVSLAGDGAVLAAENGHVYACGAPLGKVCNSVGAGDSMVAGFLAGCLQEQDYSEALKLGICAGSASAFSEELAARSRIDKLLSRDMNIEIML